MIWRSLDALWSLKESHEDIGEAKEEHRMVQLEKLPLFTIHRFESSSDVFMRVVALEKSFPTHIHMHQSDERGLRKVRFKTEQNAESKQKYSSSTKPTRRRPLFTRNRPGHSRSSTS